MYIKILNLTDADKVKLKKLSEQYGEADKRQLYAINFEVYGSDLYIDEELHNLSRKLMCHLNRCFKYELID